MVFVHFLRATSPDLEKKFGIKSGSSKHNSRVPTYQTINIFQDIKFWNFYFCTFRLEFL